MAEAPLFLTGAAAICTVISIAAFQILMGLALVAMIVRRTKFVFPPITLPLVLFMVGTLASLAASGHARQGLPQVKKFIVFAMLFLVVSAFRSVRQLEAVALGWALAASLSAIWALKQFAFKYQDAMHQHRDFYTYYIGNRITGFMSHWMTLSGEMMMALMVIAAMVFFSTDRRWTAWLIGAAALVSAALLAAETRSMWGASAAGGLYLIWFWRRWAVLLVPVLAGVLLLVNPFNLGERMKSVFRPHGDMDSNAHRAMTRAIGWEMIKAHPWLGVGPERVGPLHLEYLPPGTQLPLPTGYYEHLHNIYVHYAAERGVPTMLALLWMFGRALFDFIRALRRTVPGAEERWMLHAAIAVMIAFLTAGYFEVNFGDSEVLGMFLAILGAGYVAVRQVEERCKA